MRGWGPAEAPLGPCEHSQAAGRTREALQPRRETQRRRSFQSGVRPAHEEGGTASVPAPCPPSRPRHVTWQSQQASRGSGSHHQLGPLGCVPSLLPGPTPGLRPSWQPHQHVSPPGPAGPALGSELRFRPQQEPPVPPSAGPAVSTTSTTDADSRPCAMTGHRPWRTKHRRRVTPRAVRARVPEGGPPASDLPGEQDAPVGAALAGTTPLSGTRH